MKETHEGGVGWTLDRAARQLWLGPWVTYEC